MRLSTATTTATALTIIVVMIRVAAAFIQVAWVPTTRIKSTLFHRHTTPTFLERHDHPNAAATKQEEEKLDPPPKIIGYGGGTWNVSPASSLAMRDAIASGVGTKMFYRLVDECFLPNKTAGHDNNNTTTTTTSLLFKKAFEAINVASFVNYNVPVCDLETFSASCALVGAAFLTDDILDEKDPNHEAVALFTKAWSTLPRLTRLVYNETMMKNSDEKEKNNVSKLMELALSKLGPLSGMPKVDGLVRLYAHACAFAKIKSQANGNEGAYDWFDKASEQWIRHNADNILERQEAIKNTDDNNNKKSNSLLLLSSSSLEDALVSRSLNGGYRFFMAWMLASLDFDLDPDIFINNDKKKVLDKVCEYVGLHTCLINDILSYDRESTECGAVSESIVEFFRQQANNNGEECDNNKNDAQEQAAAIAATVTQCNLLMKQLSDLVLHTFLQEEQEENNTMLHRSYAKIFDLAVQDVAGTMKWCLQADRYTRRDYILGKLTND